MDIMVQGEGRAFYKPNEVELSINFFVNDKTYDGVLKKGTESVEKFIEDVLLKLNVNKDELKTRNFRISKNIRYDYDTKKNIDNGFDYNQAATLKVDYSLEFISSFMDLVSLLENPPRYNMNFSIKEKEDKKHEVMASAYKKAEEKAKIIAMAAGKTLRDCIKVDFKPFDEKVTSRSHLADADFQEETAFAGPVRKMSTAKETIQNTFTPEDVEIREVLYCLWIAE